MVNALSRAAGELLTVRGQFAAHTGRLVISAVTVWLAVTEPGSGETETVRTPAQPLYQHWPLGSHYLKSPDLQV